MMSHQKKGIHPRPCGIINLSNIISYGRGTLPYLIETDKWKYKASQYDHVLDEYIKSELSQRFKKIGDYTVQRDLYSSFLQSCMDTLEKPDRNKCIKLFDNFVKMQNELINEMKAAGISYPTCFGF